MIYKLKNQFYTFNAIRSIENEFVDFKTYSINKNFKAINADVYTAFNKRDKVRLQRSLSENMFAYAKSLHKESANKRSINPFLKKVNDMKLMQARVYAENDHLLPEEQWAQITMRLRGIDESGEARTKYTVFERRLADKLDYYDWKICILSEEEDFKFMNDTKL